MPDLHVYIIGHKLLLSWFWLVGNQSVDPFVSGRPNISISTKHWCCSNTLAVCWLWCYKLVFWENLSQQHLMAHCPVLGLYFKHWLLLYVGAHCDPHLLLDTMQHNYCNMMWETSVMVHKDYTPRGCHSSWLFWHLYCLSWYCYCLCKEELLDIHRCTQLVAYRFGHTLLVHGELGVLTCNKCYIFLSIPAITCLTPRL